MHIDSNTSNASDSITREEQAAQRKRDQRRTADNRRFADRLSLKNPNARELPTHSLSRTDGKSHSFGFEHTKRSETARRGNVVPEIVREGQSKGAVLRAEVLSMLLLEEKTAALESKTNPNDGPEPSSPMPANERSTRLLVKKQQKDSTPAIPGDTVAPLSLMTDQQAAPSKAGPIHQLPQAVLDQMTTFALLTERDGSPEFCVGLNRNLLGGATLRLQLLQKGAIRLRVSTRDQSLFGSVDMQLLVAELRHHGLPIVESELEELSD